MGEKVAAGRSDEFYKNAARTVRRLRESGVRVVEVDTSGDENGIRRTLDHIVGICLEEGLSIKSFGV